VNYVVGEPVQLSAPLELQALLDLRSEMICSFHFGSVQHQDTPQVLQILHALQLWDTRTFHLKDHKIIITVTLLF